MLELNGFKEGHRSLLVGPRVSDLASLSLFLYLSKGGNQLIWPQSWWLLSSVEDTIYERVVQGSMYVHSPEC